MMPAALPFFRVVNYLEAALWMVFAAGFLIVGLRKANDARRRCLIAAIAFFLFGLSDLVEVRTGAWYRPMGLLLWKGACLAVFAWLVWPLFGKRKNRSA